MSRLLHDSENNTDFELGDQISFIGPDDTRLTGRVTRVYFSRQDYRVEVNGQTYAVNINEDHPRREMS